MLVLRKKLGIEHLEVVDYEVKGAGGNSCVMARMCQLGVVKQIKIPY